jgi:hypothetical protein
LRGGRCQAEAAPTLVTSHSWVRQRKAATAMNQQHPPAHREGWMISGQETVFCWIPVPELDS